MQYIGELLPLILNSKLDNFQMEDICENKILK
jgi:hypothetical protein